MTAWYRNQSSSSLTYTKTSTQSLEEKDLVDSFLKWLVSEEVKSGNYE